MDHRGRRGTTIGPMDRGGPALVSTIPFAVGWREPVQDSPLQEKLHCLPEGHCLRCEVKKHEALPVLGGKPFTIIKGLVLSVLWKSFSPIYSTTKVT